MDSEKLVTTVIIVAALYTLQNERLWQQNSVLKGHLRYLEVLGHEITAYILNHCGMKKPVFDLLLTKLTSLMGVLSDRNSIRAGEKLMTFWSVLRRRTYGTLATVWQHGYRQESQCVHEVIESLLRYQGDIWANCDPYSLIMYVTICDTIHISIDASVTSIIWWHLQSDGWQR